MELSQFQALAARRASHRAWTGEPVDRAVLEQILAVAATAPSGHNQQPWHFTVIEGPAAVQQLGLILDRKIDSLLRALSGPESDELQRFRFYATHFTRAPVVIAVSQRRVTYLLKTLQQRFPDRLPAEQDVCMEQQSVGAAIQNLLLATEAAGLGGCWMTAPTALAQRELEEHLAIPEGYRLVAVIPIGHPTKVRTPAPKRAWRESVQFR